MKLKWTSTSINLIKFLISLFIVGLFVGLFIYIKQPSLIKTSILSELQNLGSILNSANQNNFIYHILLLSFIMVISILVIGLPIILFYFFYESVSMGFLIASFFHYKKFSGLLYSLIFLIVNKIIIYVALTYIFIMSLRYAKKVIISIQRKDYKIYEYIFNHVIKMLFIIAIVIISDIFIYFFSNKILAYFIFLL
ncbi:MAG: stage II sporulation protein M [Bacilli bacterium]|nr:stage II sporulation protein M [Bacilli bacterium]